MRWNRATESPETSLRLLVSEAGRVAREMASLREDRVDRLCGPFPCFRIPRSSRESRVPLQESAGVGFSPFYAYPFLFASAFPGVTVEALRTLALANRVLLEAILLADKKIDETRAWTPADFCILDSYFHKAFEILTPLFPVEHTFWQQTQEWYCQYARAVVNEQLRHRHRTRPYTREEFFEISTGKVALIKTTLLALGLLTQPSGVLAPLMASQDRFLVGFQCFDDLRDWKEDLRHGNFTFLLTRVFFEGGFHHQVRSAGSVPFHEVGQTLYHRGLAEDHLRMAENYFQGALESAKPFHVPLWSETVQGFLRHCRTTRLDLAEIRRRTTTKRMSKPVASRIEEAFGFILRASLPTGAFSLARSTTPYMRPSKPLAPSRFVTSCMHAGMTLLRGMDSRLNPFLLGASQWLSRSATQSPDPSLPAFLEASFTPILPDAGTLTALDESLEDSRPLRPHGLFWAHLLLCASRAEIRLTKLIARVQQSIDRADYLAWTRFPPPTPSTSKPNRGVCHPLLALLLFCCACGPDLPHKPLHAYLLRRGRTKGAWNNPTETALSLLCLLATGYRGPELSAGVDRLIRTQEGDGSWPPNALCEMDNHFYGSRELTTAWCLLALFVYHLAPVSPAGLQKIPQVSERRARVPKIVVNPGLHHALHTCTLSVLNGLRSTLPPPWPQLLYIGNWPGMPPHFLLNTDQGMAVGVNVVPKKTLPVLSTECRPLTAEIIMAVMSAHRCLRQGPLRDRLERIFVAGLALATSVRFLPRHRPWQRLGMRKLDWAWCREHEAFLWEELRRFLLHPSRRQPVFQWLLPDQSASPGSPVPKGASLFLGTSLFRDTLRDQEPFPHVGDLLGTSLPDVLRTFRRKVGLDREENCFA